MFQHYPAKMMELFVIVVLFTTCFSYTVSKARKPLLDNIRAPLFAELDMSQVDEQLKEYIDENVEIKFNETFHEKIEYMINKKHTALKSELLEIYTDNITEIKATYDRTFSAIVQQIKSQFSELEHNLKREHEDAKAAYANIENQQKQKFDELYRNITKELENKINATTTVKTKPVSGKGWTKHNGHCYYYGVNTVPWETAKKRCEELGGYFLKVDNEEENRWTFANIKNKSTGIWIGLSDLHHDTFRWTVDNTGVTYSTWYPGYGSKKKNKTCVAFNNKKKIEWFNTQCNRNKYYICEANNCL